MPSLSRAADLFIHVLAFVMAILEFLLRCFRRGSPRSEQTRPLCTEEDSVQPEVTGDVQPVTQIHTEDECPKPVTPSAKSIRTFGPPLAQHDSPPQQLSMDHDSGFVFPSAFPAQALQADAGAPPTPGLQPGNKSLLPDGTGHPEDSSSPLELRTRNIIARTPLSGPSPASTSPVSTSHNAGTPLSDSTPVSNLQQTPSDSGLSTPSVFGLPDFMLEGDYMGMQTPQIVGMKNPVTAFRENKQLKRHETPFDTRVEHLMEKERLFREMYVQHKSVQGSDAIVRQRRSTGSSKALADMRSSPQMGIENIPSTTVTT